MTDITSSPTQRPIVAIATGDPAGIGPELCLRALAEPNLLTECLSAVFGDASVLERVS
jgi:4-hydroxythreonine-4-phosphate dehydrogenase